MNSKHRLILPVILFEHTLWVLVSCLSIVYAFLLKYQGKIKCILYIGNLIHFTEAKGYLPCLSCRQSGINRFSHDVAHTIYGADNRDTDQAVRCTEWAASLLFTYGISRFCHDEAHLIPVHLRQDDLLDLVSTSTYDPCSSSGMLKKSRLSCRTTLNWVSYNI